MLLPFQLGVGSKGGVEPVVRAVEKALEGSLPDEYSHLVSLDFSNAFNSIDRRDLASALKDFAPSLYRVGKWVYGQSAKLVVTGGDGRVEVLESLQGVRQGDPFGPLFFSLAMRRSLQDLATRLGPERLPLAYLDDVYVLAEGEGALAEVEQFWEETGSSISLNARKCAEVSLDDVRENGLEVLGTMVGPAQARQAFLEAKVEKQVAVLSKLPDLASQHALLLLRQCLQQDLRHLQRTLRTDDLPGCWDHLDSSLVEAVFSLRRSVRRPLTDVALITLPARLGGLGILSHTECAPLAYAAASDSADAALAPILGLPFEEDQEILSQRSRCAEVFAARQSELLSNLNPFEKLSVVEAASTLGRRWLSVIPFSPNLALTDAEVATGLHFRTLCPGREDLCFHCAADNTFGHDDVCSGRAPWTLARHEQVKRVLASSLQGSQDLTVVLEPTIPGTGLRTDFRVTSTRGGPKEFDLTIVSLATVEAERAARNLSPEEDASEWREATRGMQAVLEVAMRKKVAKYAGRVAVPFVPLVVSIGGGLEDGTLKAMKEWREVMKDSQWSGMLSRISVTLLRARSHFWHF
jgi:hypothetical protein